MKTLGIIGGLGPMATAYFMELVTGMTYSNSVTEYSADTRSYFVHIGSYTKKSTSANGRSRKTVEGGGSSVSCNPVCYSTLFLQGALPANRSANYFSVGKNR